MCDRMGGYLQHPKPISFVIDQESILEVGIGLVLALGAVKPVYQSFGKGEHGEFDTREQFALKYFETLSIKVT